MTKQKTPVIHRLTPAKREWIARLNILLRFAYVDPWKLTNGKREELLDELHLALYGFKRNRADTTNVFADAATPQGISDAQRALKKHLECTDSEHNIELKDPWLRISNNPETRRYRYTFTSRDFTTLVFVEYADILFMSDVTPEDILKCTHCGARFVPKRRPTAGEPTFCSKKCRNVIAARKHRARAKARKKKQIGKKK